MGKIVLVLGGIKSGKTSWAQERAAERAAALNKNVAYIATSRVSFNGTDDEGMRRRIERHRASRPRQWITWEESLHVASILPKASQNMGAVIIDCLTLLATNIILEAGEHPDREETEKAVLAEVAQIIEAAEASGSELIIISNYVEAGLIAPNRLGGLFQDIIGMSHQLIAKKADEVVFLTAGIPRFLKKE